MDFIKKHYEKVILSIVLVGLAVAAAALPLQVSNVNQKLEETRTGVVRTPPKPFKLLDDYLKTNRAVIQRLEGSPDVKFSSIHFTFNPVEWKKRPDGQIGKSAIGNEAALLEVTKIDELRLIITFEPAGEVNGAQTYKVSLLRETDRTPQKQTRTVKIGKSELFTILSAEGPPENPTALLLQLKDDKDVITVRQDGGYNEVIGYSADLRYPLGKQVFTRRRKSDTIRLEDETYKIVTIDRNQVVLSNETSQSHKRTTLKLNATAQVNPNPK